MDRESGDIGILQAAIQRHWPQQPGAKARPYINQFYARVRAGSRISGKVKGNHGTYTVSIDVQDSTTTSACSCYVGRSGYCHHCHALAYTFLQEPTGFEAVRFEAVKEVDVQSVCTPAGLQAYLQTITLDSLVHALKAKGITHLPPLGQIIK